MDGCMGYSMFNILFIDTLYIFYHCYYYLLNNYFGKSHYIYLSPDLEFLFVLLEILFYKFYTIQQDLNVVKARIG